MHPREVGEEIAVSLAKFRRFRHDDAVRRRTARLRDAFVDEERVHVRVGHPLFRADDGAIDLAIDEAAFAIDLDVDRKREPLHARIQRADAVRQTLRQHRHGAAGEVDRGPALECFFIERAPLGHVMRDVGDVHAEEVVAVRELLHFDGVVEIFRGLAVDGDDVVLAQVDAFRDLLRLDFVGNGIGRGEHFRRKNDAGCGTCG